MLRDADGLLERETEGRLERETEGAALRDTDGRLERETEGDELRETDGRLERETEGDDARGTDGRLERETEGDEARGTGGRLDRETEGEGDEARGTDGRLERETEGPEGRGTVRTVGAGLLLRIVRELPAEDRLPDTLGVEERPTRGIALVVDGLLEGGVLRGAVRETVGAAGVEEERTLLLVPRLAEVVRGCVRVTGFAMLGFEERTGAFRVVVPPRSNCVVGVRSMSTVASLERDTLEGTLVRDGVLLAVERDGVALRTERAVAVLEGVRALLTRVVPLGAEERVEALGALVPLRTDRDTVAELCPAEARVLRAVVAPLPERTSRCTRVWSRSRLTLRTRAVRPWPLETVRTVAVPVGRLAETNVLRPMPRSSVRTRALALAVRPS